MSDACSVHEVGSPDDEDFRAGFAALAAEFGPRGELERREVIEAWLRARATAGAADASTHQYFFLVARTREGALAGVRDCHVVVDRARRAVVVYLAHVLVLPAHRRGGLGARLREAPRALGRRALASFADGEPPHLLLVAEMEPYAAADEASRTRLVAYGRAGFAAIAPSTLAYAQPDFRAPNSIDTPRPVPLLLVTQVEPEPTATALPRALAEAAIDALFQVFATHCAAEHLQPLRARAHESLHPLGDTIPLAPLPSDAADTAGLASLARIPR